MLLLCYNIIITDPEDYGQKSFEVPKRFDTEPISKNYFTAAADLIEKIADLSEALRSDRMPDTSDYDFMFDEEKIEKAYLPESVKELEFLYGKLDEIEVHLEYNEDDPSSSISLRFHFQDGSQNTTTLAVERPGYYQTHRLKVVDYVYHTSDIDARQYTIQEIPAAEIRRCVASLLFPSTKSGDLSQFDQLDLNDGSIYESLVTAMQKHARHFVGNEYFQLHPLDQNNSGRFSYTSDDGELIYAELHEVEHSDISFEDGEPVSTERILTVEIDLSHGVSIQFSKTERSNDIFETEIFRPELLDYEIAKQFINNHIRQTKPVQTEPLLEPNELFEEDGDED